MAVTQFAFGSVRTFVGGALIPAVATTLPTSEAKTPSASNQQTTAAATSRQNICRVATDTAVYVAFGASPDATVATARYFMPANTVEYFAVIAADKGAVVTP